MENKQLQSEIDRLDLTEINTTSKRNGYPSNIGDAVIGFDNYEQALEFAERFGLTIMCFEKRDGWGLWYRSHVAIEPLTNTSEQRGDNYLSFEKMTEAEYYDEQVRPRLADFDNLSDLETFIDRQVEIWECIERMGENQLVITCNGCYDETVDKTTMHWYHDTKHVAIGCIIDRSETE